MIRELHVETARRLEAGLNGDADQRAATSLLIGAGHGVWPDKLRGWPEYVRPLEDPRSLDGLYVDWRRLREDLADDDRAWDEFDACASSPSGRRVSEEECEERLAEMVPPRPWHGASSSELVVLRIALEIAPGGLLGDGVAGLDSTNRAAVMAAIADLVGVPALR